MYLLMLLIYLLPFPPRMDSTTVGRWPKAAGPPLWRRPKASSIMWDGKAPIYQKLKQIHVKHMHVLRILSILRYSPYWAPPAIQLAKSATLQ